MFPRERRAGEPQQRRMVLLGFVIARADEVFLQSGAAALVDSARPTALHEFALVDAELHDLLALEIADIVGRHRGGSLDHAAGNPHLLKITRDSGVHTEEAFLLAGDRGAAEE